MLILQLAWFGVGYSDKQGIATDMLKIMSEFFSAELLVSVEALQVRMRRQ